MANKVQIEILLNFERFEECGQISYEVIVNKSNHENNCNFTKDRLECPYCTETIDVKFKVLEEHLLEDFLALAGPERDDENENVETIKDDLGITESENTECLKESLLSELYDFGETNPPVLVISPPTNGESLYISDSDETLSTCTLLNIKYLKEIEDAIESMKIDTLDESSLINFIEENTNILNETHTSSENDHSYDQHFELDIQDLEPPPVQIRYLDSTKHLSDDEEEEEEDSPEQEVSNDQSANFHLCPCKRVYKLKKYFLKHMKQYHPDFPLEDCATLEPEPAETCVVPKRDGSRPIHRCNVCEKVYWSRRSYRRHMVCLHPDEAKRLNLQAKTYRCQYCDKIYFTSELLNQHLLLHVNPDHYQCGYCSKSFATHNNLKRHINAVHLRIKSYICEVCGVRFNQRYSLRLHHQELHGTDGRYECNDCGKTYGTKDKLKSHIKWTHHGYGKTECKLCGKSFLVNNYKRHLRDVHKQGQQLEYPCRYCEKIFNRRAYRDIHECTHTGEKRYSCKICNERFTDPGYRYAHMRRCHSPEFEKRKKRLVNKNNGLRQTPVAEMNELTRAN